ncbi:hypothetical protein GCM10022291_12800 [Postechiella marina]|uniref:Uncharacterized protein n=1 Tax=Postechiella marina TaxID=943941 RepID=A0ABP8C5K9_9FLAO
MLKNSILTIVFLLLIPCISWSQNTYIPDDNFEQALIDLGFDTPPLDNYISTTTVLGITNLNITDKNISDLTGIEDFINLNILTCDNNNLTSLNVTTCTKLTQLFCRFNQLSTIDVTKNIALDIFWCEGNQLTSLDVTKNINLISLVCRDNPINQLDVTKNTSLNVLSCQNNGLSTLDVSKNIDLDRLTCDFNQLTTINTSNNLKLTRFSCGDNQIADVDISNNTKLKWFWCTRNNLTTLDVTQNIDLEDLTFADNQITEIDVSNNSKLEIIRASRNALKLLNTSSNTRLVELACDINNITTLDISNNPVLERFSSTFNALCSINSKNGNPTLFTNFSTTNNPNLTCIFVDDVAYSNTNWTNKDATTNYVATQEACNNFGTRIPEVDVLSDFTGISYTLPTLINGNYFTASNGNGLLLNAGDKISTSQTIYIFNTTACESNESNFNVLITQDPYFIPKYFTPNNDGNHDYWKVFDTTNTVQSISIFDRYGKLLKYLSPNSNGWNGTYKGQLMPSDDYWYLLTFNTGETLNGHFTLKR